MSSLSNLTRNGALAQELGNAGRTQVERCNRHWRWLEKLRYKWRRRWVVGYGVLFLNRSWVEEFREPAAKPAGAAPRRQPTRGAEREGEREHRGRSSGAESGDRPRRRPAA